MSLRTRSKVLFVMAGLLFAGALVCAFLWRDQHAKAEEAARFAISEDASYRESQATFEKSSGEWRLLAILGVVLSAAAAGGGMVGRRDAAR